MVANEKNCKADATYNKMPSTQKIECLKKCWLPSKFSSKDVLKKEQSKLNTELSLLGENRSDNECDMSSVQKPKAGFGKSSKEKYLKYKKKYLELKNQLGLF